MEATAYHPYSIGRVTQLTGVSSSTLRAWEAHGLLSPDKSASGHRRFAEHDVNRVRQIEALRRVEGLSLENVRSRLASSKPSADCTDGTPPGAPAAKSGGFEALGTRIRMLRTKQGLTLAEFASSVGMAASHLSMLERGKAFASPSKLAAIAHAFGESLGQMLGSTQRADRIVTRRGEGRAVDVFGPDVDVEQLHVGEALMDCEVWSLRPGARSKGSYSHPGEEFIFVLDGTFDLAVDDGAYDRLVRGDSAYFNSARLHRWRNTSDLPAILLWINTEAGRSSTALSARAPVPGPAKRAPTWPAFAANASAALALGPDALALPQGTRTYRVIDTHTAGHPTRVLLDEFDDLKGATVREKRDDFRARYDHLRPQLLHEPRGHAATFGLVLTTSEVANFGAIFVSSYAYLDMCGHGTIGFARTLDALGRLPKDGAFTLETPAGVVSVTTQRGAQGLETSFRNVASQLERQAVEVVVGVAAVTVDVAYGGCRYALVRAGDLSLALSPETVGRSMALGAEIKAAANAVLERNGEPLVDSVLFYEDIDSGRWRQLVVLADNKFDRSPCGTGSSARVAERVARGVLGAGDTAIIENIFGLRFEARVEDVVAPQKGGFPKVVSVISGTAHLSAYSTLIFEDEEPLPTGFLCR